LLMLFLFSDVGIDDAPTRIRVGSHMDVARFLAPAGEDGRSYMILDQIGADSGSIGNWSCSGWAIVAPARSGLPVAKKQPQFHPFRWRLGPFPP
jgi:hypothetical protein